MVPTCIPMIFVRDDLTVCITRALGSGLFIPFKVVQVFQEQNPRGLPYLVEFASTPGVFM